MGSALTENAEPSPRTWADSVLLKRHRFYCDVLGSLILLLLTLFRWQYFICASFNEHCEALIESHTNCVLA